MHSLVHGAAHSSSSHGHVLGSPRLYDITLELFFLGRRRTSYRALVAAASVRAGDRVLDVGCGTGYFARVILDSVGPAGRVVGLDPSQSMIDYARLKSAHIPNCDFQVGAAEALPFPAAHFDVVVSSLVMHHLSPDLRVPALEEMRRVLRPGGRLLVAEARNPRYGLLGLLARAHGFDRMAQQIERLELLPQAAGFGDIKNGEVPPWLRYVTAAKM